MSWSEEFCQGFLLAAIIHKDKLAARAVQGCCSLAQGAIQQLAQSHAQGSSATRAAAVQAIAGRLRPPISETHSLPPRALALLSSEVAPATGARWLSGSYQPRPGFVASDALKRFLRQLSWADVAARHRQETIRHEVASVRGPCHE